MKVIIENYRGWEIYFDTEKEDFYTVSNEYDSQQTKRSYASVKKYIDDYIKENAGFKPILIQNMPHMTGGGEIIKLIGIRKDKAFIYEDNGVKKQFSKYDEINYFLVDSQNDANLKKLKDLNNELNEQRKRLHAEIKEIEEKIIRVDVKQIRKNLLGE